MTLTRKVAALEKRLGPAATRRCSCAPRNGWDVFIPRYDAEVPEPEPQPTTCAACGRERSLVIVRWVNQFARREAEAAAA